MKDENTVRIAWLKDGIGSDGTVKTGVVNNKFTGNWVVMTVPASEGLFSAAKLARSSSNVHPCTLLDGEFWHSQNIAAAVTTAILGGGGVVSISLRGLSLVGVGMFCN